jgi:amino acid efflux transporter
LEQPTGLRRVITLRYAVSLYISSVLGAGILVIPGLAAQAAGPGSLLAWLLLSLASYPFAYTFARLSARRPESGGIYAFSKEAFGIGAGTVVAWLFIGWATVGGPAISLAAGAYVASVVQLSRPETFLVAGLLLLAAFSVNYSGIRLSGRVQLATVVIIITVLSVAVVASSKNVTTANFTPFLPNGPVSVGVAAALIVWSYLGYENVSNVAEEFRDPKRDFNRSIAISVLLVSILYLAVALVTIGTGAYRSGGGITPFSILMSSVFGTSGRVVISALAVVIIFSTINAYVAGMTRVIYAAARDGGLPRALAKVDQNTGVPGRSVAVLLALVLISLSTFYLLDLNVQSAFLATSGAAILTYVIGSAAGIRLLKERGARRLLPWVSLIVSLVILPFIGTLLAVSVVIGLFGAVYNWFRNSRAR